MAVRQYIGARYVPEFYENSDNTAEWRQGVEYEPLTIVTWNGNSYTSKKTVPTTIGAPNENPAYWVSTGVYNQQVEELSNKVDQLDSRVSALQAAKTYNTIADMIADFTEADGTCLVLDSEISIDGQQTYKPGRSNYYRWTSEEHYFEYALTKGGYADLIIPDFQPAEAPCSGEEALPHILRTAYSYCGVTKPGGFNLDNGTTVTNVQSQRYSGPFIPERHQGMQCSQFINTLIYGVDYEKSKLADAANPNFSAGGHSEAFVYNGTPLYLAANEMAHVCAARGWYKETGKLCYAEVGDLLFFARYDNAGNWRDIGHVAMCVGKLDNLVIMVQSGDVDWFPSNFRRTARRPGFDDDSIRFTSIYGNLSEDFSGTAEDGYVNALVGIGRIPYNFPHAGYNHYIRKTFSGNYTAESANVFEYACRYSENITGRFGIAKISGWTEVKNSRAGFILSAETQNTTFPASGSIVNTDTETFQGGILPVLLNCDGKTKNAEIAYGVRLTQATQADSYNITADLYMYD